MGLQLGLYVLGGMVAGGVVVWVYNQKYHNTSLQKECRRLERELCEWEEQANAFADYNERQRGVRETRKAEIVSWLQEAGQLQSSNIADRYDISTRTVRNYMTELVEAGRVNQSDETGRGVFYTLIEK